MSKRSRRRQAQNRYAADPNVLHRQATAHAADAIRAAGIEGYNPEPVIQRDSTDNSDRKDPARHFADVPPNFGRSQIPHVHTFQGLVSSIAKTYKNPDEAVKHSLENARYMRNDLMIMECLEQRQRVVAGLNWHIEVEGAETPYTKALRERMTHILKMTPRFTEYRRCLLEAIWYGKQANENIFGFDIVDGRKDIYVKKWRPIMGDKLVFRQDYGDNAHPEGEVGVRVGPRFREGDLIDGRKIVPADAGMAVYLSPDERHFLTVHKHMIEDAAYEDPLSAGAINGIGIRSRIYWTWFQKQELLALFMEYLERSALGFEIWYYDDSNPKGREDTEEAAKNRIGRRNIVLFPKRSGEDPTYGVEHIEPNAAGAEAIQRVLTEFFGHAIKRYILGQTLSSEAGSTGLGSGVAELHLQTMLDIIKYDATNLEETITRELLYPLQILNDPQAAKVKLRFVIETEAENMQERLDAYKAAFDMGAKLREKDVMEAIGSSIPEPGEPVLSQAQMAPAQPAGMPGQEGPPKAPGTEPPGEHHQELHDNLKEQFSDDEDSDEQDDGSKWESAPVSDYARAQEWLERYGRQMTLFDESKHPRASDGRFGDKPGEHGHHDDENRDEQPGKASPKAAPKPLTEAQKRELWKTPEFKKWFGKSKVVNKQGEPQETYQADDKPVRVYHGTRGDFDTFEKRWGAATAGSDPDQLLYGPGFYFTEDHEVAGEYSEIGADVTHELQPGKAKELQQALLKLYHHYAARQKKDEPRGPEGQAGYYRMQKMKMAALLSDLGGDKPREDSDINLKVAYTEIQANIGNAHAENRVLTENPIREVKTGGSVIPAYLSISNPLHADDSEKRLTPDQLQSLFEAFAETSAEEVIEHSGHRHNDQKTTALRITAIAQALDPIYGVGGFSHAGVYRMIHAEIGKTATNYLFQKAGFDGITHIGGSITGSDRRHRVWIAFEPTQIKSAVANAGTFDPASPNIKHAREGRVERYKQETSGKRWITLSGGNGGDGAHVLIDDDGKIHEGPSHLKGRKVGQLNKPPEPEAPAEKPKKATSKKEPAIGGFLKRGIGVAREDAAPIENPNAVSQPKPGKAPRKNAKAAKTLKTAEQLQAERDEITYRRRENKEADAAEYAYEEIYQKAKAWEETKQQIRKDAGLSQQDYQNVVNFKGSDHASRVGGHVGKILANLDVNARGIAYNHPDVFPNPELAPPDYDFAREVWEIIGEGKAPLPRKHDPEVMRRAVGMLLDHTPGHELIPEDAGDAYEPEDEGGWGEAAWSDGETADDPEAVPFRKPGIIRRYWQAVANSVRDAINRYARRGLWNEELHPRDERGEFTDGAPGNATSSEPEAIGKGSTGAVTRQGDTVSKAATRSEGAVYKALAGTPGIAAGKQVGQEIQTPHYSKVISVDDIPREQRRSMAPLIAKNVPRLNRAMSALSAAGYSYNDQLQIGLGDDHKADIFDFSMAEKNPDATRENLATLNGFYHQFGLEDEAKRTQHVSFVLSATKQLQEDPDAAEWLVKSERADAEHLTKQLDGKAPTHAYYATNARHVGLGGIAQTEPREGVKVILSPQRISEADQSQWELTPVVDPPETATSSHHAETAAAIRKALGNA